MRPEKEILEKYNKLVEKGGRISPSIMTAFEWILGKKSDEDCEFDFGE